MIRISYMKPSSLLKPWQERERERVIEGGREDGEEREEKDKIDEGEDLCMAYALRSCA